MISITEEQKELLSNFKNYVPETYYHCLRVKNMVCKLVHTAREKGIMHFSCDEMAVICKGAMLHDIGKINIDNKILTSAERLTNEEKELIKGHARVGAELIEKYLSDEERDVIVNICLNHHERVDGSGYNGQTEIDEYVQVISVCDVYDALVSDRVYREGYDTLTAVKMIECGECGVFPEWIVECLKEVVLGDE